MCVSIVIPAHDEATVLGRCLDAVLDGSEPGELEVVVACNGCTDGTADVARSYGSRVRVVESATPSKTDALNLGDDAATAFPRIYLDADVMLPLASVRKIAAHLRSGRSPAAAPAMEVDLTRSSWTVRAVYRIWTNLPYVREGMIGVGVYALSEEGRGRFGRFPDVIADDGFVRMHFRADERMCVADAPVRVVAPATLGDLIKVKTRSRLGGFEIARRFPDLAARERSGKNYTGAVSLVLMRPWLWPDAVIYAGVNVAARVRARRQMRRRDTYVWERDTSSRSGR